MRFKLTYILPIFIFLVVSCRQVKNVPQGSFLLVGNEFVRAGDKLDNDDLDAIVRQHPNYKRLGVKWKLMAYNTVDSTKVALKRQIKNKELREINQKRRTKQSRINEKRIARARARGADFYNHKIISLKDTVVPRKFLREWYKYKIGEAPVIFDSLMFDKSIDQLNAYLISKGYYYGSVGGFVNCSKNRKCKVTYSIETGPCYTIDSVFVVCDNKEVEEAYRAFVAVQHDLPLIGESFDSDQLDDFRNRVAKFMRDSSFYGFSANHIRFVSDTSKLDMQVDLGIVFGDRMIRSSKNRDSLLFVPHKRTYINEVYFHVADSLRYNGNFKNTIRQKGLPLYDGAFLTTIDTMRYQKKDTKQFGGMDKYRSVYVTYNGALMVKPSILELHNNLESGALYGEKYAEDSYSGLLRMELFKAIKTDIRELGDTNLLDVHYYLTPSKKQSYSFQPRATNANGFLGVSLSVDYTNRNLFKGAERFTFSVSGGFESQPPIFDETLNGEKIKTAGRSFNTLEIGPSMKLQLPGFFPFRMANISKKRRAQTIVSSAYNYQKRADFERGTFQLNYSWEFLLNKTSLFEIGLPAASVIKFVSIDKTDQFAERLNTLGDLFLLNVYSDQFIWQDWRFRYEYNIKEKLNRLGNSQFYVNSVFDPAGNLLSLFKGIQDTTSNGQYALAGVGYSQFLRMDNELIYAKPLGRERSVNLRLQAGAGLPYGNTKTSLPYDYSFFAGGANDNRGWRARGLGPGGYKYYLDTNRTATQIGDIRFGVSAEYRFAINTFFKGALFLDAGNVWTAYYDENRPGGQISKDMFNQIAVATGFGIRMDLEYFIVRVDVGFPIRNASLPQGEKWIFQGTKDEFEIEADDTYGSNWKSVVPKLYTPQLHFGIGYPF
ncbi:outer membrane protein assembly factor [Crocinitomicaceae bacterium]|nr:outer membrane protein assembly factor [Crocinitomicaceae bacterium]